MDLNLQPLAQACFVTGEPFTEEQRVVSFLVRPANAVDIVRYDVSEAVAAEFAPPGFVACRWAQLFKARRAGENADRTMKLTAENLFVTLADPLTEPTPENTRLLQFLALMLERKKVLRPKGRSADGEKNVYEHAKLKQLFEVPVGDLSPEFFIQVQEQLSVLVGPPKVKVSSVVATPPVEPSSVVPTR
jgi:hypothetical protein